MIRIFLSKRLGELRLTQADLARMTGIRPNTINELYHEIAYGIKFDQLEKICIALKCDIGDLIVLVPPKSKDEKSR